MVKLNQSLDRTFGALSDSTRRAVLERLARGPCQTSELASEHSMTLAGMLKHVRILETAGLVRTTKHGRSRFCEIQPESCAPALEWLTNYRERWHQRFRSLEAYLDQLDSRDA